MKGTNVMKLAVYSILTVIAMTGSTYAQNQCGKGAETHESQASSSQSTEDNSEKKDLVNDGKES
jgi:hypothetical protein